MEFEIYELLKWCYEIESTNFSKTKRILKVVQRKIKKDVYFLYKDFKNHINRMEFFRSERNFEMLSYEIGSMHRLIKE